MNGKLPVAISMPVAHAAMVPNWLCRQHQHNICEISLCGQSASSHAQPGHGAGKYSSTAVMKAVNDDITPSQLQMTLQQA